MGDILTTLADDAITDAVSAEKLVNPSAATAIATVAGQTITAGELETATASLQVFLSSMIAAVKAKNYAEVAELTVDEALTVAKDAGIGGTPVAIGAMVLPIIFGLINSGQIPLGTLSDNAGEQQEADVQSSVGL